MADLESKLNDVKARLKEIETQIGCEEGRDRRRPTEPTLGVRLLRVEEECKAAKDVVEEIFKGRDEFLKMQVNPSDVEKKMKDHEEVVKMEVFKMLREERRSVVDDGQVRLLRAKMGTLEAKFNNLNLDSVRAEITGIAAMAARLNRDVQTLAAKKTTAGSSDERAATNLRKTGTVFSTMAQQLQAACNTVSPELSRLHQELAKANASARVLQKGASDMKAAIDKMEKRTKSRMGGIVETESLKDDIAHMRDTVSNLVPKLVKLTDQIEQRMKDEDGRREAMREELEDISAKFSDTLSEMDQKFTQLEASVAKDIIIEELESRIADKLDEDAERITAIEENSICARTAEKKLGDIIANTDELSLKLKAIDERFEVEKGLRARLDKIAEDIKGIRVTHGTDHTTLHKLSESLNVIENNYVRKDNEDWRLTAVSVKVDGFEKRVSALETEKTSKVRAEKDADKNDDLLADLTERLQKLEALSRKRENRRRGTSSVASSTPRRPNLLLPRGTSDVGSTATPNGSTSILNMAQNAMSQQHMLPVPSHLVPNFANGGFLPGQNVMTPHFANTGMASGHTASMMNPALQAYGAAMYNQMGFPNLNQAAQNAT